MWVSDLVFTVSKNKLIFEPEMGDCGSWVLDSISGDWVGHIVAGKMGTAMAYITLARDIMQDISDQLETQDVQMRTEDDVVGQPVEEAMTSLPVPRRLEGQEHADGLDIRCQDCLTNGTSDLAQDSDIERSLLHFFGCLKFSEREAFLRNLPEDDRLKARIRKEQARTATLRKIFEREGLTTTNGKLLKTFRHTLSQRFPRRRGNSHLLTPEIRDSNKSASNIEGMSNRVILSDLNANVVYFKKPANGPHTHPYDHPHLEDTFPNQNIPLSLLLSTSEKNPLTWRCEKDMIRWFHIPANNMLWVEVGRTTSCKEFSNSY